MVAQSLSHRWRILKRQRDRGAATAELVIATPLLLFLVMLVIQAGLWAHATHAAQSAASRGLEAARVENGSAGAGDQAAHQALSALASGVLDDTTVSVDRSNTTATVTISGTVVSVVPGLHWTTRATVTGDVERFVPDTGG